VKRAFRDAYNVELSMLHEGAAEFAREYPEIAGRLGGLLENNSDPMIRGLLEGSAFLAARVQLKLQEEFRTFTREMLEQFLPGFQEPIPSAMLVKARPPYADPDLISGLRFQRGDYIEAILTNGKQRIPLRFSICAPLTLWPIDLSDLNYLSTRGQVATIREDILPATQGGLRLDLGRVGPDGRFAADALLSDISADHFTFHFTGPMEQAARLYEQIHAGTIRVSVIWDSPVGTEVRVLPADAVKQIGFGEFGPPQRPGDFDTISTSECLLPGLQNAFAGFGFLREAFIYPRRFLGFRLTGLHALLKQVEASQLSVLFEFGDMDPRLRDTLTKDHVALHTVPAVNLFREDAAPVKLDGKQHEYEVRPLSSPLTDYEFHRLTDVRVHFDKGGAPEAALPMYQPGTDTADPRSAFYYGARRRIRRKTTEETRRGVPKGQYLGTETWITMFEPKENARRLEITGWCSNRHLPTHFKSDIQGQANASDIEGSLFYFCDQSDIRLHCIDGPTPAKDAVTETGSSQTEDHYWRLVNHLKTDALGLSGDQGERLRELLRSVLCGAEGLTEIQINGITDIAFTPETGTVPGPAGFLTVRGIRADITMDETAFEGSGVLLLGAILDRFLADYAAINSFTRTVIHTLKKGRLHSFPRRLSHGRQL
jgi:type VI secretion system protein ImpG